MDYGGYGGVRSRCGARMQACVSLGIISGSIFGLYAHGGLHFQILSLGSGGIFL